MSLPKASLFIVLLALALGIDGQQLSSSQLSAFKSLERDLTEIEILLKELDVQLSKELAYGWREDVANKVEEWRDSVKSTFSKLRSSVKKFWSSLTTREGNRLPPWVYTSFGGALDDVMKYLEERLANENDGFRTALLEVVKNTVRIYRNRIREASEKKPTATTETVQPPPAPPAETNEVAPELY